MVGDGVGDSLKDSVAPSIIVINKFISIAVIIFAVSISGLH